VKALNIIETAYRGTLEEQDDTMVWITHAMTGAGADLTVLLRGNAVNYAVKGQDASGLAFGEKKQTHPPTLDDDLVQLLGKGVGVYIVEEDLSERGIKSDELIDGLKPIARGAIAGLLADFDQIWHW
jgi:sulfur relay (sulfurtransferase) DsrF/TusC family protein